MRNRVYITSIYEGSDIDVSELTDANVAAWTNKPKHKNVLTFVPSLNGLFLNGVVYNRINDFKNAPSVKTVCKLAIINKDSNHNYINGNYIKLVQEKLHDEFNIDSIGLSIDYHLFDHVDGEVDKAAIIMTAGERVQMFIRPNIHYSWEVSADNCVAVDRNYIIHALASTSSVPNRLSTITLKYDDEEVYKILVKVYSNRNLSTRDDVVQLMNQIESSNGEYTYDDVINNYDKLNNLSRLESIDTAISQAAAEAAPAIHTDEQFIGGG